MVPQTIYFQAEAERNPHNYLYRGVVVARTAPGAARTIVYQTPKDDFGTVDAAQNAALNDFVKKMSEFLNDPFPDTPEHGGS